MRTYQKPIRNLSETYAGCKGAGEVRVELRWSYDDLRLITNVYRTNNQRITNTEVMIDFAAEALF